MHGVGQNLIVYQNVHCPGVTLCGSVSCNGLWWGWNLESVHRPHSMTHVSSTSEWDEVCVLG